MDVNTPFPASEELSLSENSINYLNITRKWTMFFAILSFIGLGILLVASILLIASSFFMEGLFGGAFPGTLMGIIYLVFIGIGIIPNLYLFKFSKNLGKMMGNRSNSQLEEALRYLMSYYRFMGILTIIGASFYIIAIILGIIFGLSSLM